MTVIFDLIKQYVNFSVKVFYDDAAGAQAYADTKDVTFFDSAYSGIRNLFMMRWLIWLMR